MLIHILKQPLERRTVTVRKRTDDNVKLEVKIHQRRFREGFWFQRLGSRAAEEEDYG